MKNTITWAGIIMTLVMVTALAAHGASNWPQFKGNMGNTGTASTDVGVSPSTSWETAVEQGTWINGAVLDGDGNIVFLGLGGRMYSVSPTGTLNWTVPGLGSGNWGGVAYSDDNDVIYSTSYGADPEVHCIDAATGSIKWSFSTGNGGCDCAPTIGPDGTIYIALYSTPNAVLAITDNGTSATMKWSVQFNQGYVTSAIPVYDDGVDTFLYYASQTTTEGVFEPNVACIRDDATTGTIVWGAAIGNNWAQGTVDSGGNYYIATFTDWTAWLPATVFKFDKDGNSLWSVLPGVNTVQGSPTLSADESTIYFGGHSGRVISMDASDGSTNWLLNLEPANEFVSNVIALTDGTLYAVNGPGGGKFYRIQDLGDKGIPVFGVDLDATTATPCLAADGTMYVMPEASTLYAFAPEGDTVEILTTSVGDGELGTVYYDVVTAIGGDRTYAWSIDGGSLPPGLSLDAVSGEITGTPTTGGTYDVTVKVTDSTTPTATTDTVALTINVTFPAFEIATAGLSLGEKDAAYSDTLATSDAPAPITWSIASGTPGPFSINSSTGEITGTPTAYGTYVFKVKAVDNDANEATKDVNIQVIDPTLWQMHQNTKRHIGTAVVAGPAEFIPKWSVFNLLGNGAPALEDDYVYLQPGWPYLTRQLNASDGSVNYETAGDLSSHQRGTVALGDGVDEDKFFTCWGDYEGDAVAYYKSDGSIVSIRDGSAVGDNLDSGHGFQAYSNGRVYDIYNQHVYSWEVSSGGGWSVVYDQTFNDTHMGPPSIFDTVDNKEVMVFGSRSGGTGIFAISVDDGAGSGWSQLWNNTTVDVTVEGCCTVDSTNNCYFGARTAGVPAVVSLDGLTGELNWKTILSDITSGTATKGTGALSFDQKTFYIQALGMDGGTGKLYALNTQDGTVKWALDNGLAAVDNNPFGEPAYSVLCDKDGKVYFTMADGEGSKVACVTDNGTSATLNWAVIHDQPNQPPRSFSMDSDGTLYFVATIDNTDSLMAIKDMPPAAPQIINMIDGSMELTFTSNGFFKYKIESSTSPYDYNEANMTWVTEIDDLQGAGLITKWTDTSVPTSGEKYYRVFAKSATFGDVQSETVGLKHVDVFNGRNMVSTPFEPYSGGQYLSCAEQVTGSVCWTTTLYDGLYDLLDPWYLTFEDDGTDQFVRINLPAGGGFWGGYLRFYFEVEGMWGTIDASGGAFLEFDVRMYQDPGDPNPSRTISSYYSSYGPCPDHTYLGRIITEPFYWTDRGDPYPTWQHVVVDLSVLLGDPGFSVDNIDALTIITPGCGDIVNANWIDMKDLQVTYVGDYGETALDTVVADQLTGHVAVRSLSDTIEAWDVTNQKYLRAWYQTGTGWKDWDVIADPPQFGLEADRGYWFNRVLSHADTAVMMFGRVSDTARTVPIDIKRNLVGSCFPVGSTLDDSGLVDSGFIGHVAVRSLSDTVEFWNNATAQYQRFWYRTGVGFQPWNIGEPMRDLAPGDSIWVNLPLRAVGFTWTYPQP